MQASGKVHLTRVWLHIRAMVLPVLSKTIEGVLKLWSFCVVFRMVFQCTVTEMACVEVVRGYLCRSGDRQTAITVVGEKTAGRRKPSQMGRQTPCGWVN